MSNRVSKRRQIIDDIFCDAIDADFNPDIVWVCVRDAYDEGHKRGMKIGALFTACFVGFELLKAYKKRKEEESE